MLIPQRPSLILPVSYGNDTGGTLASTETINDAVEHTSLEIFIENLSHVMVHILATEVIPVGGNPGNLHAWVELSPWPTSNTTVDLWPSPLPTSSSYWAAIGGGGGAVAPVSPDIIVATGVSLTVQNVLIPFTCHSMWCRVVLQTPVAHATSYWLTQVLLSGKGVS